MATKQQDELAMKMLWEQVEQQSLGRPWNDGDRVSFDGAAPYLRQLVTLAEREPEKRDELILRTVLTLADALRQSQAQHVAHMRVCISPNTFVQTVK